VQFKYPLQIDPFSIWDKAKVAAFILKGSRLTQGDKVKAYEEAWEEYTGSKYAVFVNSGSSANFLVAQRLKDKLVTSGQWTKRKTVVFPALTWSTSITPFLLLGFKPHFIDISKSNWGLDYEQTVGYLDRHHEKVAAVFPTALLGMNFDLRFLNSLEEKYGVKFLFDGCEASFNKNYSGSEHIVSKATSTTSSFFAHYANSIEGGVVFCDNEEDYAWYLMARNHGLVRALSPYEKRLSKKPREYLTEGVHSQFDFHIEGSNFRNTDINAYFGLLDSARWYETNLHRVKLGIKWRTQLDSNKYSLPSEFNTYGNVPFSLPIVVKDARCLNEVQNYLTDNKIESRPIISGSLRFQRVFAKYMKGHYPVADYLHTNGLYIGLNYNLKEKDVEKITKGLNAL
jgi:CDP-6-deoxy-D-xylo-4-hexulose-3-dehydrase